MGGMRRVSATRTREFVAKHMRHRRRRALAAVRSGALMPSDLEPDLREEVLAEQARAAARRAQQEGG